MDFHATSLLGGREVNEDYVLTSVRDGIGRFILCDGLGGHGQGEVASELIATRVMAYLEAHPGMDAETLSEALEQAQEELLALQSERHLKHAMKTTAVVLEINEDQALWAHIGDSRLYVFRHSKVVLRTLDHSVPQMLVLAGEIKEKEIRRHPDRNHLLRVMGAEWGAQKYDIAPPRALKECQAFLLCSDGFWENITEKEMAKCLRKCTGARDWVERMTEIVHQNGNVGEMDNHSAIAVILD